ncbi:MAG: hypothetical protein MZW92_06260 [Comamonadaceae bacterium]|nr:hypothetical protein [Comamonadaceae bacterium]
MLSPAGAVRRPAPSHDRPRPSRSRPPRTLARRGVPRASPPCRAHRFQPCIRHRHRARTSPSSRSRRSTAGGSIRWRCWPTPATT